MRISGLQKLTLLDYQGHVACTVFTGGCNFRCPFCHNASLVLPEELKREDETEQVLSFLKKRCGAVFRKPAAESWQQGPSWHCPSH